MTKKVEMVKITQQNLTFIVLGICFNDFIWKKKNNQKLLKYVRVDSMNDSISKSEKKNSELWWILIKIEKKKQPLFSKWIWKTIQTNFFAQNKYDFNPHMAMSGNGLVSVLDAACAIYCFIWQKRTLSFYLR